LAFVNFFDSFAGSNSECWQKSFSKNIVFLQLFLLRILIVL